MNGAQLQTRLSVLDAYVEHLRGQPPGASQSFVWELDRVSLYLGDNDTAIERRGSPERDTLLRHVRARGCQVKANDEGFMIRLVPVTP